MTKHLRRACMRMGLLAACAVGGCDSAFAPDPSREDISGEEVIVRIVYNNADGQVFSFYADRVRFLQSQPHSIDRVIEVRPNEQLGGVGSLRPEVGDRLRISTRFLYLQEAGGLSPYVPDWPYDRSLKYRLGLHALTAVENIAQ